MHARSERTKDATRQFTRAIDEYVADYNVTLDEAARENLRRYFEIVVLWNPRLHLFAACSPIEFAMRHVLESSAAVAFLPARAQVIDIGSGGGAPAIPLLIVRSDIRVALYEATLKKAIFLREAISELNLKSRAEVVNQRFEQSPPDETLFNEASDSIAARPFVVTCRALERFAETLPRIVAWSPSRCTYILFGSNAVRDALEKLANENQVNITDKLLLPHTHERFIFVAQKIAAS